MKISFTMSPGTRQCTQQILLGKLRPFSHQHCQIAIRTPHRCYCQCLHTHNRTVTNNGIVGAHGFHSGVVMHARSRTAIFNPRRISRHPNVLVDQAWAGSIVDCLQSQFDITDQKTVIFDSDAGSGLLSSELLQRGAHRVVAFEERTKYVPTLEELERSYGAARFLMQNEYLLRSRKMQNAAIDPSPDGPFHGVPALGWNHKSPLKVVGVATDVVMMSYVVFLAICLSRQSGLCAYGCVDHFFLVTGMEHKLLSDLSISWTSMLVCRVLFYKLFYDYEVLMKVPVSAFSPAKILGGWKIATWDPDHFYLLKLSLKRDVFDTVCPLADLPVFINTLLALYRHKNERFIALLDTWCPGFGGTVLEMGYGMMQQVKHIPMEDIPGIYKALLQNPTYKRSGLKVSMEHNVCRTSL